ncbi:MAG: multidrug efflux SMR transporter [Alphaproteobacteria bacterium]
MGWALLAIAITFELMGTTSMKLSEGFSRLWPSLALFACYAISFSSLTFALRSIDLSIAYAIWSGLGTAVVAAIGIIWFKEPVSWLKMGSLCLILLGVVGLHASGKAH